MKICFWLLLACQAAFTQPVESGTFKPALLQALITDPSLDEISGIATSRLADDRFWVHDDSPRPAELQAIDGKGRRITRLRIEGVRAIDWEDIASYELDGKPWLLIGDVGDNAGVRKDYELIAVEEPDLVPGADVISTRPAWRLRFRYPDGAHDCEAMAVDVPNRQVLLINKHAPLAVYSVPLGPPAANAGTTLARKLTPLNSIPQPDVAERLARFPSARFGGSPSGLDIDVANTRAILLTYRDIWLFTRTKGESWTQAFSGVPQRIPLPPLAQAEAIGFDRQGSSLWISGERLPAPLLRLEPLNIGGSGK